jgi:hypothetical protein
MSADFSRVRFNPLRDYAGVELEQGRVLLDADVNELMAIVDRRLRALASDTLGRATVSSTTPDAFKITTTAGTLLIGKGRLYVDGLLAENHGAVSPDPAKRLFDDLLDEAVFADPVRYDAQPYLPNPPAPPTAGLVYLDVWKREVTDLEQPDLVESALGVDTSSRLQTVWQVRVLAGAGITCGTPDADVPGWSEIIAPSTGVLSTGTFDVAPVDDPCELPPTGGYRGLENQLYRVEIHNPGQPDAGATFKWSRDNVGSRVASIVSASELKLETLGRDDVLRFNTGDWVEITDDVREFSQAAGEMRRITVIEETQSIKFPTPLPPDMLPGGFPDSVIPRARHTRVRRWNQAGKILRTDSSGIPVQVQDLDAVGSSGVISVPAAGTTLLLENGVTVSFASTGATGFRIGDYWAFAARTADASVEILDRAPPLGIPHQFARLATVDAGLVTDCRNPWPPRAEGHDCSCTACVTAESHASGKFTIQDAVNQVRESGGTICLGPGEFAIAEPVRLINARSVRICGKGPGTVIASPGGAFALQTCVAVAIENLAIVSLGRQSAVTVDTALGLSLHQLVLAVAGTNAPAAAISLQGVVLGASIRENLIVAPVAILANDPAAVPPIGVDPGVSFLITAALAIEDNLFSCPSQAVTLNGTVLHLMSTRINGNEVLGCADVAISTLGLGAAGSSMTISGNRLGITGSGIRCGVNGVLIEGNKLVNSAVDAFRPKSGAGITLTTGFGKNGTDQCQILANQVSGFASAGIAIGAPVRDLIVKLNIIENCGNGIISVDEANAGSVSIENNQLQNIGPGAGSAMVVGVGVTRADAATIAGNTIRALAAETVQSPLRAAILTFGVLRPRVSGNEVTEVAPPGDFLGIAAGIMLRAPLTQFDVSNNQVQRDGTPSVQTSNGVWFALTAMETDPQTPLSRTGSLTTIRVDPTRVLVLGAGRPYVFGTSGFAPPPPPRGAVLGNVFNARGTAPAVEVSAAGECLFNDNRVESAFNSKAAVTLATTVAIVSANRVRSGDISIQVAGAKAAAVLGNVTTGQIIVPGGLQAPWEALNLRV